VQSVVHSSKIYSHCFLLNIKNLDKNRANPSSIGLPGEGEIVHQKPFLQELSEAVAFQTLWRTLPRPGLLRYTFSFTSDLFEAGFASYRSEIYAFCPKLY
jgi:hypothetical protein